MFSFGLLTTACCRGPPHGQACWWSHVHHFRASCQIWPCSASAAIHPGSGASIRRRGGLLVARMMNGGVHDFVQEVANDHPRALPQFPAEYSGLSSVSLSTPGGLPWEQASV